MELELTREHIARYERRMVTCLQQEETLELIVSDANPDIREIVEACGQLFLSEKSAQDGMFTICGTINGWVLYQPEGEPGLCRMDIRMPISMKMDAADCPENVQSVVRPVLCRLEARTLNPRKVLVRADVCADVELYAPNAMSVCTGVICGESAGAQYLNGRYNTYLTRQVREKAFSVYEEVRTPNGFEGAEPLVCLGVHAWCTEKKLIGNKLIFKGEARIRVRGLKDNRVRAATLPIGFSQVIEMESLGEQGDVGVELYATNLECARVGEDGRMLNITLDLIAQAVVREPLSLELLQDAYATHADLTIETEPCLLPELVSCATNPRSMRELLETQTQAKDLVDADVRVCRVDVVRQGDASAVQAQLQADVMYLDEQDQVHSMTRTIVATGQMDVPEGVECSISCSCPGDVFAAVAAGGVELRFNLAFDALLTRPRAAVMVAQARLTERDRTEQKRPSAVLRMPMPGERLWDIAKAYRTTIDHICQANALEEADLPKGRMLLIPSGC